MNDITQTSYFKICEASVSGLAEELLNDQSSNPKIDMPKNTSKTSFPLLRTIGVGHFNKRALCILD
jgi:hypothetical protein